MKRQGPHQDAEKSITICGAKQGGQARSDPEHPTRGVGGLTRRSEGEEEQGPADQLAAALGGLPLLVVGGLGVRGDHGGVGVVARGRRREHGREEGTHLARRLLRPPGAVAGLLACRLAASLVVVWLVCSATGTARR